MEKYRIISESLRQKIECGQLKENDRVATEAELCQEFAVSRITAMRAVKELESAGFLRRVAGRGTFVCRQERRNLLPFHLFIPNVKVRYYAMMAESFGNFFCKHGLPVSIVCTQYDPDYTQMMLQSLKPDKSQGLAIIPHYAPGKLAKWLELLTCPVITGSRALCGFSGKQIIVDEEAAGEMAAQYLLKLGHKHILYVGPADDNTSPLRHNGVVRAVHEFGKACTIQTLRRVDSISLLRLKDIFAAKNAPTACIAADDLLAAELYDQLKALDLEPGKKTALIGLDGSLLGLSLEIPLTTVEFPGAEIGTGLASSLFKLATGAAQEKNKTEKISPRLIIRASCGETKAFYRHEYLRELVNDYR